jgi:hypothetical protein
VREYQTCSMKIVVRPRTLRVEYRFRPVEETAVSMLSR